MPLGVQRLNVKKSQPNTNIVFIKPLPGPNEKTSQDFLERIAAQCLPVMREHHLYVMSLEEFPPNREFVGRNFNAGEVVQLVLRSPGTGRWLPFGYVQMVMMHELAHCKQMNHSRAFWAVRNSYAEQMRGLWSKGYKGEGMWGRGSMLGSGEPWERDTVRDDEVLPEHLCGGTFRSRGKRGRKKGKKPTISYQERKQRRIEKKFGKQGMALGADEEVKVKLEKGKKVQAKPRVAGSARGRELRAAAALARFDQQKVEAVDVKSEADAEESGSDSDYEDVDWLDPDVKDARDVDGSRLVDEKGRGMVKVCEDETIDDPGAKDEMRELQDVFRAVKQESPGPSATTISTLEPRTVKEEEEAPGPSGFEAIPAAPASPEPLRPENNTVKEDRGGSPQLDDIPWATSAASNGLSSSTPGYSTSCVDHSDPPTDKSLGKISSSCSVCSYANPFHSVTCGACANVLDPASSPNCWKCTSEDCSRTDYVNSGDCGICGLCGGKRKATT